jgi:hypothetical protein
MGVALGAEQFEGEEGQHIVQSRDEMGTRQSRQKMLQRLFVALRDHFGHPFHVLLARLHQSTQVLCRPPVHIAYTRPKMMGKTITKIQKATAHFCQWAFCIRNPLTWC